MTKLENRRQIQTTGGVLDSAYLKENYQLIAVNVTKQAFHTDLRAIQQIVFEGVAGVKLRLCEK